MALALTLQGWRAMALPLDSVIELQKLKFPFSNLPIGSYVYYLVFPTVAAIAATVQKAALLKYSQNL